MSSIPCKLRRPRGPGADGDGGLRSVNAVSPVESLRVEQRWRHMCCRPALCRPQSRSACERPAVVGGRALAACHLGCLHFAPFQTMLTRALGRLSPGGGLRATGSPGCERGTDVASSGPSIRVGGQTRAAREVYECCCSACRWAGAKA